MPIKVKHEASMGALAQLALLAGMRPSEDIKVPTGGGGGGRGMRMSPSGRQGPLSYGANRAIQLEEMQRAKRWETRRQAESEQQLREEAEAREIEQQKWIKEFSPQTKQKIAKDNNAIGEIQTQIANGKLTPSRGGQMIDQIQKRQSSYRRTNRPRNSSDPPEYQEGQGVGQEWLDQWGNVKTRKPTGEIVTQVSFDKTPQGMQLQTEAKRQSEISTFRQKIVGMTRKELNKEGDVVERQLTETERLDELEYAFPELRAQRLQQEQQKRVLRQVRGRDEAINKMLEERDRKLTENVTLSGKPEPTFEEVPDDQMFIREPEDRDLPPRIGHAQSVVRHFTNKYKKKGATYLKVTDIPDEHRAAFMGAAEILERYAERK